ncbi:MAG: glycosylphosphatidylinositol anchor biosynthesis [Geoglossum umbratile]|nr:MAG: glycosylphosphatidylinositol anchor biosynthesis [Geoglossum umbratile]
MPWGLILALSGLADRLYYQTWAFPPFRFLYFNIAQSLSVFYGRNDWHYYISQGFPLLLTAALPFGILGVWRALYGGYFIRLQLAVTVLFVTLALSLISHKEVRFIYPILPMLHVITAEALVSTIYSPQHTDSPSSGNSVAPRAPKFWKFVLSILVAINILIAFYASVIHQSGVTSVLAYLRKDHESRNTNTTIGFLMPCHSTPWRSHLIHPTMHAWALTCEPPVNLPPAARAAYLDEADIFYADPSLFLRTHFAPPPLPGKKAAGSAEKRQWPDSIVFFEQLQPVLEDVLKGNAYVECWRGFNTHWHDDWRRRGDVVVWCLGGS